ncbi:uncharacterized protein, partial [Palaemon carinicauda]|uniref:uncharacterized protein n=1 Tax=Palaemon carinicauda TaxID=392227 RepID=UPI0035B57743
FFRIRGVHPDPEIYIKGQRIPCASEAKFLGLIFDCRLTWVSHFKALKAKCLEAMNLLKVLTHTSWRADRNAILKLYKSLIFSKISYGCEIYSSATPSRLKILESIHHASIRLSTGAFRTSPITSLLADAGELPLDLYRMSSIIRYWFRLQILPNSSAFQTASLVRHPTYFELHTKSPQPFGFRVKQLFNNLDIIRIKVLPFKMFYILSTILDGIQYANYCQYVVRNKSIFVILANITFFVEARQSFNNIFE